MGRIIAIVWKFTWINSKNNWILRYKADYMNQKFSFITHYLSYSTHVPTTKLSLPSFGRIPDEDNFVVET